MERHAWRASTVPDVVAALAPHFTTYSVDLAGFGRTPAPPAFPYTIEAQADAVAAFMLSSNISDPILVGHSMGGGVCLHLADRANRTGSSSISKMVLISPVAYPPVRSFPQPNSQAALEGGGGPGLRSPAHAMAKYFLMNAFAPGNPPTTEQIDGYAAGLSTEQQRLAFQRHAGSLSSIERPLESFSAIKNETLLIWGEEDKILLVNNGHQLKTEIPNCILETVLSCGHVPHEELPETTIPYIDKFLANDVR